VNNEIKPFDKLSKKSQDKRIARHTGTMVLVCKTCNARGVPLIKCNGFYYCMNHIKEARRTAT